MIMQVSCKFEGVSCKFQTNLEDTFVKKQNIKIMINILGHQYPASTTIEDQNLICSQRYVHLKFIILSLMHKKRMIYLLLWIKMTK